MHFNIVRATGMRNIKGALTWYGKLTWESAHAWNLVILHYLVIWGMTCIFMVLMNDTTIIS